MRYWLLVIVVILAGFWLRIAQLAHLPTGLSNDEAVNVVDAFHISRSWNFPLYEDHGRPEPLYRILLAVGALFTGTSVWAFRYSTALMGVLTIPAAYWAMRQCLRDLSPTARQIAGLAAAAALMVAISHITLSRALYRAILQPPFMLLFIGFLLRGLHGGRRRDYVLSALFLTLALYSYTSALVVPLALLPLLASLLLFRRPWRKWLPGLVWMGLLVALLVAPLGWRLLNNPSAVVGRSLEVNRGTGVNLSAATLQAMIGQFFSRGDINPQYNVEQAPLLPAGFAVLFVVGLLALFIRMRQPSSALIGALLILCAVPVIAGAEIPHGLRVMGEFAVFPMISGLGVALILQGARWVAVRVVHAGSAWIQAGISAAALVVLTVLTTYAAVLAGQSYRAYWDKREGYEYTWRVFDRELPIAEWFFRPDRRDFGRWLTAQTRPLLLPVDELATQTTRAWLVEAYPSVTTAGDDIQIPPGTQLVVPWSLELNDLRRETRHYALLANETITILPPFSAETHSTLLKDIESGQPIARAGGEITLLGYVKNIADAQSLAFEPPTLADSESGLATYEQELRLVGWRGPDTLAGEGKAVYTLDWHALRRLGHVYSVFLQLATADYQRVAGDEALVLPWLFPSTLWRAGETAFDAHHLQIPAALAPGAYRLVAGAYVSTFVDQTLAVTSSRFESSGQVATIGWVKVPQLPAPTQPMTPLDAVLGDSFALRGASIAPVEAGKLRLSLMWVSLADRPAMDATIFVHLVNREGEIIAQQDARPWDGQYPTFIWDAGEQVTTVALFDMGDIQLNDLSLRIGMYTFPDLTRLPVVQDGNLLADGFVLLTNVASLLQP
jgi:4-amino-4-deoxy-L-arabinose transferase-like glycosyltransferase